MVGPKTYNTEADKPHNAEKNDTSAALSADPVELARQEFEDTLNFFRLHGDYPKHGSEAPIHRMGADIVVQNEVTNPNLAFFAARFLAHLNDGMDGVKTADDQKTATNAESLQRYKDDAAKDLAKKLDAEKPAPEKKPDLPTEIAKPAVTETPVTQKPASSRETELHDVYPLPFSALKDDVLEKSSGRITRWLDENITGPDRSGIQGGGVRIETPGHVMTYTRGADGRFTDSNGTIYPASAVAIELLRAKQDPNAEFSLVGLVNKDLIGPREEAAPKVGENSQTTEPKTTEPKFGEEMEFGKPHIVDQIKLLTNKDYGAEQIKKMEGYRKGQVVIINPIPKEGSRLKTNFGDKYVKKENEMGEMVWYKVSGEVKGRHDNLAHTEGEGLSTEQLIEKITPKRDTASDYKDGGGSKMPRTAYSLGGNGKDAAERTRVTVSDQDDSPTWRSAMDKKYSVLGGGLVVINNPQNSTINVMVNPDKAPAGTNTIKTYDPQLNN